MHHTWAFAIGPAIVIGLMLLAVAIAALLIWLVVRLVQGRGRGETQGGVAREDLRMVQEVHSSLAEMEKRIEALETILLDRAKKG